MSTLRKAAEKILAERRTGRIAMNDGRVVSGALAWLLNHPEFFRIQRVHSGHSGDCPAAPYIDRFGLPVCWNWQVGVGLHPGRVDWFHGFSLEEAAGAAARAALASKETKP